MRLEGSCHCQAVRFSLETVSPIPYMRRYCSICQKLAGGGGYAINLGADHRTVKIEGADAIRVYETSPDASTPDAVCSRRFFGQCGTALWHYDPRWPDSVHPFAPAIDTALPEPPSSVHILVNSKANWVKVEAGLEDSVHDAYPPESLAAWHERNGFGAGEE